ncbi:winged helix-turn-helix transcriptional regulator [Streptomyces uncialis]|uniref:winged helix-turn-helix transcriptional regulator n=1 Tax=Streptomyces uncialis TaxID=1048205 RepID=UPI0022500960|nr:winged helix-turn-helix transcriptional regulator [Streptomyces uncialis]MCX4659169.1 winged helix-turn-helix transcriptional regulator [Streptomyces uncialis]
MIPTGLPRTVHADLSRVIESLGMITPRWNVQILTTVAERPLRYTEIKARMPWLQDGQLHPKLRRLTAAGLVERTEHGTRHVSYGLAARGAELMPVLTVIAAWGGTHLEKPAPHQPDAAGAPTATAVQDIEDSLVLIAYRHATPILWSLQARGPSSAKAVAADAMPGHGLSAVYPRLRQLVEDRLVDTDGEEADYRLAPPGRDLAPVYRALSAWAAGRPLAAAAAHSVWGRLSAPSQSVTGMWASASSRLPAPAANTPLAVQTTPSAQWRAGELFSHQGRIPARMPAVASAGGHRR